ncbi:MAG TPA: ABC transporter permease [Steroidobacteraceae bacterium]|jgi:putative ABC transport system permease protein
MKYLPWVWSTLWRNRTESLLTLLALTVGFTLFGSMLTLNAAYDHAVADIRADRVFMFCRFDCRSLPQAYQGKVEAVPGVLAAGGMARVSGYRGDRKNSVGVNFVDERMEVAWPELPLSADGWKALRATPNGIFLTRTAVVRQHVAIGDTFTLVTEPGTRADGNTIWPFKVLGFIDELPGWGQWPRDLIIGNIRYRNESVPLAQRGEVGMIWAAVDKEEHTRSICRQITAMFINSEVPVFCTSVREDAQQLQDSNINLRQLSLAIAGAGLFMILFLCANGIAESVRERMPELATLKTLGYGDRQIAGLVLIEAAIPVVIASALGMGLASLIDLQLSAMSARGDVNFPPTPIPVSMFGWALLAALCVAVASALAPLRRIQRMDLAAVMAGK